MSKEIIISDHNGEPVVDSVQIAKDFKKIHRDVVRTIKNLIAQNCALKKWFFESTYVTERGRHYKSYEMTKNGFALLAMGFTGEKALSFKIAYINAFDKMEKALTNRQDCVRIENKNECSFEWYENISAHNFGNISCFSFFC